MLEASSCSLLVYTPKRASMKLAISIRLRCSSRWYLSASGSDKHVRLNEKPDRDPSIHSLDSRNGAFRLFLGVARAGRRDHVLVDVEHLTMTHRQSAQRKRQCLGPTYVGEHVGDRRRVGAIVCVSRRGSASGRGAGPRRAVAFAHVTAKFARQCCDWRHFVPFHRCAFRQ